MKNLSPELKKELGVVIEDEGEFWFVSIIIIFLNRHLCHILLKNDII